MTTNQHAKKNASGSSAAYTAVSLSQGAVKTLVQTILSKETTDTFRMSVTNVDQGPFSIPLGPTNYYLHLSGGEMTSAKLSLTDLSTSPHEGYKYRLQLSLDLDVTYSTWHETYDTVENVCIGVHCYDKYHSHDDTFCDFQLSLRGAPLYFDVQIGSVDDRFLIQVSTVGDAPPITGHEVSFTIPRKSALADAGCFQSRVNQQLRSAIASYKYADAVAKALNDKLQTIPNSGKLEQNITFEFSPVHVDSSSGAGVAASVNGLVKSGDTLWPGTDDEQVPFPPNPPAGGKGVEVNVHQNEFGGLLWAFYENGYLRDEFVISPDSIADSEKLTTNFYRYGPLQILSESFPNMLISVAVKATQAPTVEITSESKALGGLSVSNVLDVTVALLQQNQEASGNGQTGTFLAEFALTQQDRIEHLAVTQSKLTFEFHLDLSSVNLIKASDALKLYLLEKYHETDFNDAFGQLWQDTLSSAYAGYLAKIGTTGVPIPHIQELPMVLSAPDIIIEDKYVTVSADVSTSLLHRAVAK